MQISDAQIEKYMSIYLETYGRPIDRAQAREELIALVCLLEAVYKFNNKINHVWH